MLDPCRAVLEEFHEPSPLWSRISAEVKRISRFERYCMQCSQAASPTWANTGRIVGHSPALRAYMTGQGRTADICGFSSDKL